MKSKIIAIIVVVLLLAAGLVLYLQKGEKSVAPTSDQTKKEQPASAPQEEGLGAQIYEQAQNPAAEATPETNPIKSVKTNPFKEEYKNPFE